MDISKTLGLDDPSRFVTIRRVPVFDAHPPIEKTAKVPSAVSPENPDGLVKMMLSADESDLEEIAANTNAAIAGGRIPSLQVGHTKLWDAPEGWHPRHVGVPTNFAVGEFQGRPCLLADLHYMASEYPEARTYPRLSVERVGWDSPGEQRIKAIALLRSEPERPLGLVPYAKDDGQLSLACYVRELPASSSSRSSMNPSEEAEAALTAFAIANGFTSRREAARRFADLRRTGQLT